MRRTTPIIPVALALLVLALGACQEEAPPPNRARIAADAPDEESNRTTLIFTDSNWVKARLRVGHVRKYTSRMQTLLDSSLFVEFYAHDGSLNATLVADSARVDDRTGDMVAFGAVHVVSARNKTTVDTDRIYYDSAKRLLHSDASTTIVDTLRGRTLRGSGFESDESLTHYKIYSASGRTISTE